MLRSLLAGFRRQAVLQAEIIALRHQLIVLQRTQNTKRLLLHRTDRCLWVWLSRMWSGWRSALIIVKPETVEVMNIKEVLSAPRSPWQRAYVERDRFDPSGMFGSRDCVR
jgi:hypothetical protein